MGKSGPPTADGDFDYIVVGAGSAGCALAAGLSENPRNRVLVLEAGPPPDSMWIKIPAGLPRVLQTHRYNWATPSRVPERPEYLTPQGKVLGGGSSINGMLYMRGYPENYNNWARFGIRGWSWDDVLPAFRKLENHEYGENEAHGGSGPLAVSHIAYRHPATNAYLAASAGMGIPIVDDLNSGSAADATGRVQVTIGKGRRCSAYEAFLRPAMRRANLTVLTGATAHRIMFKGRKATGICFEQDGQIHHAAAHRVIVSSGAINSPHLLLLSGIGPAETLRARSIPVVHDLPGVGKNFHDHAYTRYTAEVRHGTSMNRTLDGWPVLLHALRYFLTHGGPLAAGGSHAVTMFRSSPDLPTPDIQISFRPFTTRLNPQGLMVAGEGDGLTLMPAIVLPLSRGEIALASPDPRVRPLVDYHMLKDPQDERLLLEALKWSRRCLQTEPLSGLLTGMADPGYTASDADLLRHNRANVFPGAHCAGSCAMGSGPMAVVNDQLSVHGVEGLSVCDASIMPEVIAGNTNGPTIMIGVRGADLIRE